jgi:hypothetical protein
MSFKNEKIKEKWKNKEDPNNKKRILILQEISRNKKDTKWKKRNCLSRSEKTENFNKLVLNINKNFEKKKDLVCRICNKTCKDFKSFSSHISQTHNILIKDYYDFFIKKDEEGFCKICSKLTRFISYKNGYSIFCSSMKCVNNDPNRILSIKNSDKWKNIDYRKKLSNNTKNQWINNYEYIKLMTTPKSIFRIKQAKSQIIRYQNKEERIKTSESIKRAYINNPNLRINASNHTKKMWIDPNSKFNSEEYLKKIMSYFRKGLKTTPEKKIEMILSELIGHNFKFTGNGSFWINRKNPDFTDVKNKKVIEVFGDYYHSEYFRKKFNDFSTNEEHQLNRENHFKQSGFNCLILWEIEIKNLDLCKDKIIQFIGEK